MSFHSVKRSNSIAIQVLELTHLEVAMSMDPPHNKPPRSASLPREIPQFKIVSDICKCQANPGYFHMQAKGRAWKRKLEQDYFMCIDPDGEKINEAEKISQLKK